MKEVIYGCDYCDVKVRDEDLYLPINIQSIGFLDDLVEEKLEKGETVIIEQCYPGGTKDICIDCLEEMDERMKTEYLEITQNLKDYALLKAIQKSENEELILDPTDMRAVKMINQDKTIIVERDVMTGNVILKYEEGY